MQAGPGRTPIWNDPIEFEKAVDAYFMDEQKQHTWTGLAIWLGFESRQSLEDYKKKDGFSYPIKKALLRIESIYEESLFAKNAAGPIFALKNFGWRDRQEVEQSGGTKNELKVTIIDSGADIPKEHPGVQQG